MLEPSLLCERVSENIAKRQMATFNTPVLLMVSGGSDSTALAYVACELRDAGVLGKLALLHVNHGLRGVDASVDARFSGQLAVLLNLPFYSCELSLAAQAARTGENVEALARRERYLAANEALESMCLHEATPFAEGRIFTAHTADDRAESFYMRSIVGTGPGGFRAMRYCNGPVCRPLLDVSRQDLRDYLAYRQREGMPLIRDDEGSLWREDATNAHTDRFRSYIRHEIVPRAQKRNPRLLEVLCRTMNLIADEDDMLEAMVDGIMARCVVWTHTEEKNAVHDLSCELTPVFGSIPLPLRRRVCMRVLSLMLGIDTRVENVSIEAILNAYDENGLPRAGYVVNVQGDIAVSSNKRGVRIEPMQMFRMRRKPHRA